VRAIDVFAPVAPAGLTAVVSLNSIELGWERNAEPDLAFYRVYRAEGNGAFQAIADKVEGPAFSDKRITSGTTYRYSVSAVDAAGNEGEKTPAVQAVAP
jgi:fibronectin type 3 domain-containing protein